MLLLCLLSLLLATHAQQVRLSLNTVARFDSSSSSFDIPPQDQLSISIALCSPSTPPRVIISTDDLDVHEVILKDGFGLFTGSFEKGGVIALDGLSPGASFELGLSTNGPLHEIVSRDPLFGDSTNNQAILFSHPFAFPPPTPPPQFPNYTLPAANATLPDPPSSLPNLTLIVSQTSNTPLLRTSCFLNSSAVKAEGKIINSSSWLRSPEDGWRIEYLLAGLEPQTNYTAFIIQDDYKVSGPIYFFTKSTSFQCTLVHSLPYCPATSYSIPLSPPSTSIGQFPIYDTTSLPRQLQDTFIRTLQNFTVALSTFACGRDFYSPVVGCEECQKEYRKWLCTVVFPRCTEPSPGNPDFVVWDSSLNGVVNAQLPGSQTVVSALLPMPSSSTQTPFMNQAYMKLLPCIETCTSVDRACPPFLQFRCPNSMFNGAASYGFGYMDGGGLDGRWGGGVVDSAQDGWGNVWCNAG
ncbi:hypothetical protein Agabi119p4_10280 [Agaricus bisporus var. burnettii]|uniref:FZ domain-containing protein n=1 Tax=Agaricus bisporus var. burnettii TaxID=192524 RepID=A0A8H7EWA9_AGABI|nr:hypothetical protein Agabi119p4_10280 [Agaricus bisporus var. burnettii]